MRKPELTKAELLLENLDLRKRLADTQPAMLGYVNKINQLVAQCNSYRTHIRAIEQTVIMLVTLSRQGEQER